MPNLIPFGRSKLVILILKKTSSRSTTQHMILEGSIGASSDLLDGPLASVWFQNFFLVVNTGWGKCISPTWC